MGDVEAGTLVPVESSVKYHSCFSGILTAISVNPDAGQCLLGSLAGAVSSKRVTEEPKGTLNAVGNRMLSVKA